MYAFLSAIVCFLLMASVICDYDIIWAESRENMSLGFTTKRFSNQSLQLQRLANELKFRLYKVSIYYFPKSE